jgi:cytochrome c oxidase subunit III
MNVAIRTIDVSKLPTGALDHRSPVWWGNLWLLVIETAMFGILVASYLYIRLNYPQWPPPRVDREPILYNSAPALFWPLVNLGLILVTCVPVFLCDRACLALNHPKVKFWLPIALVLMLTTIAARAFEFPALHFRWDDNAYGSVTWMLLGTHALHLVTAALETFMMLTWTQRRPLDLKHARDVRLVAIYWYWIAGSWVLLHVLVFWSPRFT